MPRLRLVCGIVVNSHGDNELRRENSHTSTDRDPVEDVDCTAAVTLIVHKVRMLLSASALWWSYQDTTCFHWTQDRRPMVLSTSRRINACKLSQCSSAASSCNQYNDNTVKQKHGAALGYPNSQCADDTSPTIAYVPPTTDDLESSEISFCQLGEAEDFEIGCLYYSLCVAFI